MSGGHAKLAPSAAHRWMNCPGSINLIESLNIIDEGSVYSREGTAAHKIASMALESGDDAWEYAGGGANVDNHAVEFTPEMTTSVQVYLDHARSLYNPPCDTRYVERKVVVTPEVWGTVDHGVVSMKASYYVVSVTDFKNGVGVVVDVEDNPQAMIYGIGLADLAGILLVEETEFNFYIVQPRAPGVDPVRRWSVSGAALRDWRQDVLLPAIEATKPANAPLVPGDWCQNTFCPARDRCPALKQQFLDAVEKADAAARRPNEVAIPLEDYEIADLKAKFSGLRSFMAFIDEEALNRAMRGHILPGFKLVTKKSNRVWGPDAEEQLTAHYGDAIYDRKLKSPAQAEKLAGGKAMAAALAYKPDNGLTLAPDSDKRAAMSALTAAEAFSDHIQPEGTLK